MGYFAHRTRQGGPPFWIFLAALAGCGSFATDGAPSGYASMAVQPAFPAGYTPGSSGLVIDRVRVRVLRPPTEWLVDTSAVFPVEATSMTMRLRVPLKAQQEWLDFALELFAGNRLIFAGTRTLSVTEAIPSGPAPTVALTYLGPGAEARAIRITPRDTVLQAGESFRFDALADDGAGRPVDEVYVNWGSSGPAGTTISPTGLLTAPAIRGAVVLRVWTATGARDSTSIGIVPAPSAIIAVSGGGQSAVVGTELPRLLVVRVVGADGLGVPGILVSFFGEGTGAVTQPAAVRTDAAGIASAQAVVSHVAGAQRFTAEVTGLGTVQFLVEGLIDFPSQVLIFGGNLQETPPDQLVSAPMAVRVTDRFGNPVAGQLVSWEVLAGGGALSQPTILTDSNGIVQSAYQMGPGSVPNFVRATLVSTGASVVFELRSR